MERELRKELKPQFLKDNAEWPQSLVRQTKRQAKMGNDADAIKTSWDMPLSGCNAKKPMRGPFTLKQMKDQYGCRKFRPDGCFATAVYPPGWINNLAVHDDHAANHNNEAAWAMEWISLAKPTFPLTIGTCSTRMRSNTNWIKKSRRYYMRHGCDTMGAVLADSMRHW